MLPHQEMPGGDTNIRNWLLPRSVPSRKRLLLAWRIPNRFRSKIFLLSAFLKNPKSKPCHDLSLRRYFHSQIVLILKYVETSVNDILYVFNEKLVVYYGIRCQKNKNPNKKVTFIEKRSSLWSGFLGLVVSGIQAGGLNHLDQHLQEQLALAPAERRQHVPSHRDPVLQEMMFSLPALVA